MIHNEQEHIMLRPAALPQWQRLPVLLRLAFDQIDARILTRHHDNTKTANPRLSVGEPSIWYAVPFNANTRSNSGQVIRDIYPETTGFLRKKGHEHAVLTLSATTDPTQPNLMAEHLVVLHPALAQEHRLKIAALDEAAAKMTLMTSRNYQGFASHGLLSAPDEVLAVGRLVVAANQDEKARLMKTSFHCASTIGDSLPTLAQVLRQRGEIGPTP